MRQYLGKVTKHDVENAFGVTILPAGILLREEHLVLLEKHRIDSLFVIDADQSAAGTPADQTREAVGKLKERSRAFYDAFKETGQIPLKELEAEIVPAVQNIARTPGMFKLFEAVKAQGDYTYEHNIGVGVISTMIGKWLQFSEDELAELTMAATLHDIGKVKIPEHILNKPGKLTNEEFELVKKHTIYGYEILKKTEGVSYRAALVALQHHEREDGSGYPLGLTADKIDAFSKIVAVADIFHAMSSDRPHQKALPFYEVVRQLRECFFGQLDPAIVHALLDNLTAKLVGQQVLLTDQRVGEIVYINPHDGEAPLIKVGEEFVDLSSKRQIQIQRIIGF
ncbi:HD-GYP domain-containing protein [Paenibacillus lycopersici]|uniref:HD-GYP domain-containing protein n=1 Tax=Paenibacillus lycopersici TaxID=2704462 RepID=A0A6C0G0V2_9BACL|nr:HD-GYP domain-containing protein [Paenibacillus lycopersici]QHT63036.1 HD-GYP domain-containing protein [Paenibacillus lycopersici]